MHKKTYNVCKAEGHLANMCKKGGDAIATARGGGNSAKPPPRAIKPKLTSFAKGTKKYATKEGAKGMVVEEVRSNAFDGLSEVME